MKRSAEGSRIEIKNTRLRKKTEKKENCRSYFYSSTRCRLPPLEKSTRQVGMELSWQRVPTRWNSLDKSIFHQTRWRLNWWKIQPSTPPVPSKALLRTRRSPSRASRTRTLSGFIPSRKMRPNQSPGITLSGKVSKLNKSMFRGFFCVDARNYMQSSSRESLSYLHKLIENETVPLTHSHFWIYSSMLFSDAPWPSIESLTPVRNSLLYQWSCFFWLFLPNNISGASWIRVEHPIVWLFWVFCWWYCTCARFTSFSPNE